MSAEIIKPCETSKACLEDAYEAAQNVGTAVELIRSGVCNACMRATVSYAHPENRAAIQATMNEAVQQQPSLV